MDLPLDIGSIKGFLADDEADALYRAALDRSQHGPVLEIGSYCGKSTVVLGHACRQHNSVLYAVDHHRGSEEHQKGELFHDPELYNEAEAQFDSFGEFRRNMAKADLHDTVVPIVSSSDVASRHWQTPLSMVFIDGGHSLEAALSDYRCWAGHIQRGGILAIHDLFDEPENGGQAPIAIFRLAVASGLFQPVERVSSLALLKRL
ncbi:putative O-methyltransferase YrrM [Litorivivens lipolytica]|uniref:Putative O-methyltransferase YrrM n=1 Tax=Litorivivens lipolytica TaxID=1524264 RepID=A0A7W4W4H6_9GAMM|nr:class I SAM-dependent methyltransferase [Litorivivens lipolytica]MBB3047291.1 putative O-methyltransferase YrrM [Litorivivens lipolytica]